MDLTRKNSTRADKPPLPELPLKAWHDTKTTLHLYAQIVGKVRLALHSKLNHWWHVPLYVLPRGFTTQAIPAGDVLIDHEFDFIDHSLRLRSSGGQQKTVGLYDGLSVGAFYKAVMEGLEQLGVRVEILAKPYDPPCAGSSLPFEDDALHVRYDAVYVTRFWQILVWFDTVFAEFRGPYYGKSTPVHLFWHSLDLTYTRFSGRASPLPGGTPADREAYSHELISFRF